MLRARVVSSLCLALLTLTACGPDRTWRVAYDTAGGGWVMHIFGLTGDRLVAAGGSPAEGQIHVIEGGVATSQSIPSASLMNWSHGFSDEDVFVVGYGGVILRWDGSAWSSMDTPTDQDLWGVWGAAPDDVWAVGGTARRPSEGVPTLLHYDGSAWSEVAVPALTPVDVTALFKIWGSSGSDIYAVGVAGAVIHYDGSTWSEQVVGARGGFSAVWGTGPDNVVLVGGLSNGHLSHFDGTEWRSMDLGGLPGISGVWTRGGVAHICGFNGFVASVDLQTYEVTEEITDTNRQFHACFGVDGQLLAVGGNIAGTENAIGVAYTRELGSDE